MQLLNARNQQIDFLRGIAILLVLILHFNLSYHLANSALNKVFSISLINALASNGNYGVTMFFVISGYLISTLSLERYNTLSKINLVDFYKNRFARIIPCLLLVISLIAIFSACKISIFQNNSHSTSMSLAIFSVITFWHNLLMQRFGYFNYCLNIFWSLSVEEVFYLFFPLLCLITKKTKYLIMIFLLLIFIAPFERNFYSNNEIIYLYGYFSCFDAIAIGCCAAILAKNFSFKEKTIVILRPFTILMVIAIYFYGISNNITFGFSLIAIGTAILLITSHNTETKLPYLKQLICRFGKNSYELYLFHIVILALMKEIISPEALGNYTKLLWMALFIFTSFTIASSIAKYYSQPLNKKLRQFHWQLYSPLTITQQ